MLPLSEAAASPFPSLNYLGMKYDIVRGNPQPRGKGAFDPGFDGSNSVVDLGDKASPRHRHGLRCEAMIRHGVAPGLASLPHASRSCDT
jgi:hypothetical protein